MHVGSDPEGELEEVKGPPGGRHHEDGDPPLRVLVVQQGNVFNIKIKLDLFKTTRPDKIWPRLFLANHERVNCSVYATVHIYILEVTFFRVPETHGHV